MLLAGMNVARFNFSHGSHEEHKQRLDQLKALREELDLPVAAMLDTKGPEIRLRSFRNGSVMLKTGQDFTLTTEDVPGDETRCAVTYAELPQDVKAGNTILLDDGLVRLTVLETTASTVHCRVENDGIMKNNKGVNIPGVRLSLPYMSQRDREDILFGAEQGFDFIAASFVRTAADVREIRRLLDSVGSKIRIIAKIENQEGVDNLSEILSVSDGIMVARGDMGVEIDFTEIPILQKQMISQCVACGKPAITATQMLDSMMEHPRPTRAEITDVANAIYDGTSAIMLSGETAAGKYPVEAVRTMDAIAGLAFGIVVIDVIRRMGVTNDDAIAEDVLSSGLLTGLLMALIYVVSILVGAQSRGLFELSENGGVALTQIAGHYLGGVGQLILAVTITFACLKTSIGLVTACAETFDKMTGGKFSYRGWAILFTAFSFAVSNVGLSAIINYSIPVLMLIYPPAIALITLAFIGRFFGHDRIVYIAVMIPTWIAALFDFMKTLPESAQAALHLEAPIRFAAANLLLFDKNLGWLLPAVIGFAIGMIWHLSRPKNVASA